MLSGSELALAGIAAAAAGLVNALPGGGTLISFPALVALGVPEVVANVTNTVALCPGYLGGALAQKNDLAGQKKRLILLVPAGIMGGLAGGILLLYVSEQVFHMLVPVLILLAAVLLAVQDRVRDWIRLHSGHDGTDGRGCRSAALPVGLSAVYGGYFGPGLSVIILAVLGLFLDDTLTRLNALKQCISLGTNVAAAVFFLFSGLVLWPFALVMAAGALFGGAIGGRIASRIDPGRSGGPSSPSGLRSGCTSLSGCSSDRHLSASLLQDVRDKTADAKGLPCATRKIEKGFLCRPALQRARTSDRRVTSPASFPLSVIGTVLMFFATIRSTTSG